MLGTFRDSKSANLNSRVTAKPFFVYKFMFAKTIEFSLALKIGDRDFIIGQTEICKHIIGSLILNYISNR